MAHQRVDAILRRIRGGDRLFDDDDLWIQLDSTSDTAAEWFCSGGLCGINTRLQDDETITADALIEGVDVLSTGTIDDHERPWSCRVRCSHAQRERMVLMVTPDEGL